ncbi:hypothetical protein KPB05_36445 [Burkholderia gladioli]|uniref:hypothetical protein n=1 Tax=Burkholderia gladioli TaxID=28095 RepID=UPI0028628604|nr:hypothetical protein [Burkholderia gladioli]MDR8092950.1 hypothetical protein [Burkholderia gladioli]
MHKFPRNLCDQKHTLVHGQTRRGKASHDVPDELLGPSTTIAEDAEKVRVARHKTPSNLTVRLNPVRWPIGIRSHFLGSLIRVAVRFGWVVVVIGPCRSGKSTLLNLAMRDAKTIDKAALLRRSSARPVFDLADLAPGPIAIDEAEAYDRDSILGALQHLRGTGFAITFQSPEHIDWMGLSDELRNWHRRITIRLDKDRHYVDGHYC